MKRFLNRFLIVLSLLFVWGGTKAMMASGGVTRLIEDAPQTVKLTLNHPLSDQKVIDLDDNNKVIEMNQGEFDVYTCVQGHRIQISNHGSLDGKKLIKAIVTKDGEDPVTVTEYPITVVADKNMTIDMDFGYVAEFKVRGDVGGSIKCRQIDYDEDGNVVQSRYIESGDAFPEGLSPDFEFTAFPQAGYTVKNWYLNGEEQNVKENSFIQTYVDKSLLVEVEFEKSTEVVEDQKVNVHFNVSGVQSISLQDLTTQQSIELVDNSGKLIVGHNIQLNVTPKEGFKLVDGTFNGDVKNKITSLPYEFGVTSTDITISLMFMPTINFGVKNNDGGAIKAERFYLDGGWPASATILSGDSYDPTATENITFTATPEEGYSVKGWYKDGVLVEGQTDVKFVVNQLSTSFNVEVEFSSDKPSVETTLVTFGAKNNVGGKVEARADDFRVSSGDELESGSTYKFTAIPEEGYEFKAWFVNNVKQDENGDVLTIENPTTGFNVEALFEKPGVSPGEPTTITLTVDAPDAASYTVKDGEKTIEFVDNVATVASGHLLSVTAVAKDGKEFKEGSVSETETRHLIGDYFLQLPHEFTTIEKDMTIQLFFKDSPKEEKTVNLTIKAPDADSYTIMDGEKKIEFVDNVATVTINCL
ncbi:MAG: hypothetical protein Q4A76_01585 [Porphyromonadaceae bacterium]|nr:hypothetical protein [Porphyromonadaceae bacterium]